MSFQGDDDDDYEDVPANRRPSALFAGLASRASAGVSGAISAVSDAAERATDKCRKLIDRMDRWADGNIVSWFSCKGGVPSCGLK